MFQGTLCSDLRLNGKPLELDNSVLLNPVKVGHDNLRVFYNVDSGSVYFLLLDYVSCPATDDVWTSPHLMVDAVMCGVMDKKGIRELNVGDDTILKTNGTDDIQLAPRELVEFANVLVSLEEKIKGLGNE